MNRNSQLKRKRNVNQEDNDEIVLIYDSSVSDVSKHGSSAATTRKRLIQRESWSQQSKRPRLDPVCSICLSTDEELANTEVIKSDCGHRFCIDCLYQWVRRQKTDCPVCRRWTVFPVRTEVPAPYERLCKRCFCRRAEKKRAVSCRNLTCSSKRRRR